MKAARFASAQAETAAVTGSFSAAQKAAVSAESEQPVPTTSVVMTFPPEKNAFAVCCVVGFTRHADDGSRASGELHRGIDGARARVGTVDAFAPFAGSRKGKNFARISADHRGVKGNQLADLTVAPWDDAGGHRIEHPGHVLFPGGPGGELHAFQSLGHGGADIDEERSGDAGEIGRFLLGHDHRRRGAGGKKNVRRDFLHDVVREAVNERAKPAKFVKRLGSGALGKRSDLHLRKQIKARGLTE